jgi:protein-disulfide isomerase
MADSLERVAGLAVVLAAMAVVASSVRREFGRANPASATPAAVAPTFLPEWQSMVKDGILVGNPGATTTIIEFGDFECPFCARFQQSLSSLRRTMGQDLALVFIHYPLSYHRFARPAARVAECANDQGRFPEMRDALFVKQDSLGLKSWESFALDAGIPNMPRFLKCSADTVRVARVEAGIALGAKLDVRGTPTIIINGWKYWGLQPDSLEVEVRRRAVAK